ncbi:MAG TPA: hypothetical protein VMS64_37670, partial [Candidatus Methylomirabilis sp.]|nr:hypothetical protein [Candidatus Methylomirabilis sp.]
FSNPRNLITVAAALTAGAGDLTLKFGAFTMGGIGTATFGAIILYQILAWSDAMEQHPGHGRAAAGGAGQNRPSTGVTSRSPVPPPMSRAARPLSRTVHADYPPTEFASRSRLSVLGQSPSIQRIRLTYDALDNEAGAATFPLRTSDVIITG